MPKQEQLSVFLTHEGGEKTISYLTIALHQKADGTFVIYPTASPTDEQDDVRPIVVRPNVSVAHCIELASALVSGRLVRDFTRHGRCP